MANWGVPPPPPPPPGPGPSAYAANNHAAPQQLADKNAAYLAKMRAKQKQKAVDNNVGGNMGMGLGMGMAPGPGPGPGGMNFYGAPPVATSTATTIQDDQPKLSLFGADFLHKASIQNAVQKNATANGGTAPGKSSKYVELPSTGLTERALFTKYKIESEKKIGAGAFARIKMVKGVADGKLYALKMVRKKGRSRGDIEAFKKEILYLSKLTNHPNIIKMYDFCDSPQGLYVVLEFCNGGNVMERMELIKNFSEAEAKHLVKQLIAGMCCYHQFNIVHRDLKLDNLMYNNGVLKIIDFGLAGDCTHSALNTPCGTIHFTAPEVLGAYDYTTAADMWSVGVVIYLLICGFPPFFDNQGNEQKLFQIIKRAKFNFIPLYFDDKEACLKELITDLLRKRPAERLTSEEVRVCEWLTGVKPPPRTNQQLGGLTSMQHDDANEDDAGNVGGGTNTQEVNNPFLTNTDADKKGPVAPYLQFQQAWNTQQKQQQQQEHQQQQQQQQQQQPGQQMQQQPSPQQPQQQYNPQMQQQYMQQQQQQPQQMQQQSGAPPYGQYNQYNQMNPYQQNNQYQQ
eukprot:CAMPEP_0202712952 /NCGR_PEP_ID=MMETSP1385-20130828/47586_1 /ASSEMBLY_ACC=CAM_ASM_000861 /TAXON_ID=933848 /ORGANISM="Elphidium margaritaceum" /LENGTH=567 /DNA_ID=CAMNT_0049373153 /DNA_START=33 /DNA_END=1736 /DNA_ORIENTATION=-